MQIGGRVVLPWSWHVVFVWSMDFSTRVERMLSTYWRSFFSLFLSVFVSHAVSLLWATFNISTDLFTSDDIWVASEESSLAALIWSATGWWEVTGYETFWVFGVSSDVGWVGWSWYSWCDAFWWLGHATFNWESLVIADFEFTLASNTVSAVVVGHWYWVL